MNAFAANNWSEIIGPMYTWVGSESIWLVGVIVVCVLSLCLAGVDEQRSEQERKK